MKKTILILCCFALSFTLAPLAKAADQVNMILATGGTAGTYYPFGGAMAKIWNGKISGMNVTAQATGGSAENCRLVNKSEAELAIVQSDTIDFAFKGIESFKEALPNLNAIAVLYPEIIQLVVQSDSPVKSFADLKGLKVGVGAPGSGTEANFRQLLDAYGMTKDDVTAQYLSFSESAEQFKDKHIDALIVVSGIPNSAIMDIGAMHAIKILDIGADVATQLNRKYPFLTAAKIPANTYKNQAEEIKTMAVMAVLIANPKVKEDAVFNITKALFDNQSELAQAHAKGKELNIETASKGVSIPFHPGAVKYYQEKGLMK